MNLTAREREIVDLLRDEPLLDAAALAERIGSTRAAVSVHLALGASYPESGGQVQSALHWDLVCDLRQRSEVLADGEIVERDGRFVDGIL